MTTRIRRLTYAAASVIGGAAILWFFFGSLGDGDLGEEQFAAASPEATKTSEAYEPPGTADVTPGPQLAYGTGTDGAEPHSHAPRYVDYAIGLHDLQGLAPDAPVGTRLEIWGAWDPPLVDEPRVQRLIPEVILKQIISPTTPEGPYVALLSLPARQVPRLIYGDEWGRLSVVMLGERHRDVHP